MNYLSQIGFVLPETDAVVFFAAKNSSNAEQYKLKRAFAVARRLLFEALCLKMGSEGLLSG